MKSRSQTLTKHSFIVFQVILLAIQNFVLSSKNFNETNRKIMDAAPSQFVSKQNFFCMRFQNRKYTNVTLYFFSIYLDQIKGNNVLYYGPMYINNFRFDYRRLGIIYRYIHANRFSESFIKSTRMIAPERYYVLNDIDMIYEPSWKIFPMKVDGFWLQLYNYNLPYFKNLLNVKRQGVNVDTALKNHMYGFRMYPHRNFIPYYVNCYTLSYHPTWQNWYNSVVDRLKLGAWLNAKTLSFAEHAQGAKKEANIIINEKVEEMKQADEKELEEFKDNIEQPIEDKEHIHEKKPEEVEKKQEMHKEKKSDEVYEVQVADSDDGDVAELDEQDN
eukprot:GAHX01000411.1.p1 GENE.GAHX01000411.1~~GAHX01000411.1.p1  ORF type:complete len:330 (+),score=69.79 GAHX01000411.1:69-1058(+)